ncbi:MAG: biphenyl 2,3-dioxygenase [Alphaproteobacteria bacterium]|nr:MAG: biphenyl 2,3-dioxygenase [Alphaproteobacteria bacterium]
MKALALLAPLSVAALITPALAAGDLTRAKPVEVVLEMGTDLASGKMFFRPKHLEFETGKAYKLELKNLDEIKHEVESHEFVQRIFTRKVEIENADGLVAEIKGAIREIEVGPKQTVDWYFVPVQTVKNADIICAIKGHKEAGMFGTITIR